MAAKYVKRDPMKTKTGKVRLGPLSKKQLMDLFGKSSVKKEKARIRSRLLHRFGVENPVMQVESASA